MSQLTDTTRTYLSGFIRTNCYADVTSTRQSALRRLIANNYFWQGYHYIQPLVGANNTINWSPIGSIAASPNANAGRRAYASSLNFYKGDAKKLMGVLGRTPNATASAINQRDDEQVSEAEDVNKLLDELRWHWDVEVMNSYLVFFLWTCGPVYGYTPFGPDGRRFGITRIPRYKMEQIEVEPGYFEDIPVIDGYDEFANGSVSLILATDYDFIKPSRMKSLEQCPWVIYEREIHKATILATYKEAKEFYRQIGGTLAEDVYGRTARDQAASSTAYNRPDSTMYWTESIAWLTPSMYDMMDVESSASKTEAARLRAEHPDGVKIVMINGFVIREESESLHDVWFECPCEVGHSLDEPALGDETRRLNRAIDDMFNAMQEVGEKGNPITFYDPQVIDPDAIASHSSHPIDYLPVMPGQGGNIKSNIYTSDPIELSPACIQLMEVAKMSMRENSGITPALSGSETKQQTLGEAEINRNMALLPHNVTWNFIRRFWSGVYTNGVRQLAKYGLSKAYFGGNRSNPVKEVEIPRLRALLQGNWKIECEEAIPMTWGQIRAQMVQLMEQGPELWAMIGLNDPRNVKAFLKCLGNRDFILPGEKQREKTLADISLLMSEQPIQQIDPMSGQPMPMASRPADDFEDDHQLVVQIVREWAVDDAGRQAKSENPQGYMNVILWAKEHQMMVPPPMMPDGSPAPAAGGGAPMLPPSNDIGSMPPGGIDPSMPLVPEELAASALEGA